MLRTLVQSRHSIWLVWAALIAAGPIAGGWGFAIVTMLASAVLPPLDWLLSVVAWITFSTGTLIWSRVQTRGDDSLLPHRWALHAIGLLLALAIGLVWTAVYFYSGEHHG